jgi:hypothetical protein
MDTPILRAGGGAVCHGSVTTDKPPAKPDTEGKEPGAMPTSA